MIMHGEMAETPAPIMRLMRNLYTTSKRNLFEGSNSSLPTTKPKTEPPKEEENSQSVVKLDE